MAVVTFLSLAIPASAAMHLPRVGKGTLRWSQLQAHCTNTTKVRYQGRACRQSNGLWRIELENRKSMLSHGPDHSSPRALNGIPQLNSATTMALQSASSDDIVCVNPNTTQFTQLIYARPAGTTDRSAIIAPQLRQQLYEASAYLNAQAASTTPGAGARFKVACDSADQALVQSVELAHPGTNDSFGTIAGDLQGLGYSATNGRYMVFYDGNVGSGIAGQAALFDDDSTGADSLNNYGGLVAIEYAVGDLLPHWDILLHEAGHNMGAVQDTAPNASLNGHCNDGLDIMCYPDGGAGQISHPYSNSVCGADTFDCNHNDYFHPSPSPGSYLDTHWNTAASYNLFLDHSATSQNDDPNTIDLSAPGVPTGITTSYTGASSVTLTWSPSVDDSTTVSYRIYRFTGTFWIAIGSSDTASFTVTGLKPHSSYDFGVSSYDQSSNESNLSTLSVSTADDTAAPTAPGNLKLSSRGRYSLSFKWNASADNVGVSQYRIYRLTGKGWKLITVTNKRSFTNKRLRRGKRYMYVIYAIDTSANASRASRVLSIKTL